jgi:hypothetical protein
MHGYEGHMYLSKQPNGNPDGLLLCVLVNLINLLGRIYSPPVQRFSRSETITVNSSVRTSTQAYMLGSYAWHMWCIEKTNQIRNSRMGVEKRQFIFLSIVILLTKADIGRADPTSYGDRSEYERYENDS